MSECGMETLGIQYDKSHPTGRVRVHLEQGTHRFEILPLQAYDFIHPAVVRMITLSVNPVLVYFGTLAQRCDISRRALKALLRSSSAGTAKFLDINLRLPWYDEKTLLQSLQFADIVKLNSDELLVLADMFLLPGNDAQHQVQNLMDRFDLHHVVITCGEEGAWQMERNGKIVETQAKHPPAMVVDTVGAGDGFAAVSILGSLLGWPLAKTLQRANDFAAAICEIRGAIPGHADFYDSFIVEWGK